MNHNPEGTNNDDNAEESNTSQPRQNDDIPSGSGATGTNNRSHRSDAGIFERFMDNFLGMHRYHQRTAQESRAASDTSRNPSGSISSSQTSASSASNTRSRLRRLVESASGASNSSTNSDASGSQATSSPNSSTIQSSSAAPEPSASSNARSADGIAVPSGDSDDRAIIITVNYVFSDENNPQDPNRTGSLIMSLPNNSSNRDPRVIQEFIRLATQMAYSSIINGLHKEKGVTLSKFNSFPSVKKEEFGESQNCSICFEKFEEVSKTTETAEEEVVTKKRRTDSGASSTATVDNERSEGQSRDPKYLVDYRGTFAHMAVRMPCNHVFGKDCLFEWLKSHTTCPLCRNSVAEPASEETNHVSSFNLPIPGTEGLSNTYFRVLNNETSPTASSETAGLRRLFGGSAPQDEEAEGENYALSNIVRFLRGQRNGVTPPEPLFPVGLSSRRTESGIETRSTEDSNDEVLDFMNLRSLVDGPSPPSAAAAENPQTSSSTDQSNNDATESRSANDDNNQEDFTN